MVEVRNEPFVGFTSLVCLTNGEKGELGELWGPGFEVSEIISAMYQEGSSGRIGTESLI